MLRVPNCVVPLSVDKSETVTFPPSSSEMEIGLGDNGALTVSDDALPVDCDSKSYSTETVPADAALDRARPPTAKTAAAKR